MDTETETVRTSGHHATVTASVYDMVRFHMVARCECGETFTASHEDAQQIVRDMADLYRAHRFALGL